MRKITEGIWQLTEAEAVHLRDWGQLICGEMTRKELSSEPIATFHAMTNRLVSGGTRISEKQRQLLFVLAEGDEELLGPLTIERTKDDQE